MAEIMKDIEKNHGFDRVKILMEAVKLDMDVVVEENKQKILNELRQMNEAAEDQQQQRMNPNVKVDVEENVQEKVYSEVERERLIEETLIQLSMSEVLPVKYFADDNNPSFPALTALIQAVIESIEYRTLDNDDLVQKIDERIALMEVSAESKQAFSELSILLKENPKVLRKIQDIIDMQIELMDNPSLLESNRSSPALTNYTNLSEQFDALNDTLISDGLIKTLMGTFAELEVLEDVDSAKSTVETFILSYFDPISRVNGPKISRTGAGEFQKTVLKDILSVTSVREVYGAYVFEGQPTMKYKSNWGEAIAERYANSSYNDEVGYTIVKNEIIPNFDEGIERAALDVMLGSSPAVVLFPKSWNSTVAATVADPIKNLWRSFVGSGSVLSSFVVAASCTGIFSDANGVLDDNSIPDYFFYLASVPILIQNLAAVMEKTTARLRDVEVSVSYIPALSIFSYGPRTTLVSMPKNRNDMFDITLAGIATSIGLSVAAMLVGLHYTEEASPDIIASYPLIPLSLLKVNTLVAQFLTSQFGDIFSQLSDPKYAESTVHLHWLVIVGALSFIGSVFQLIPLDNSVGSKLSFAALGRDTSQLITAIAGLTKLLFLIPMFFNVGGIASAVVPTRAKVLLDYILLSQLVSSDRVSYILLHIRF